MSVSYPSWFLRRIRLNTSCKFGISNVMATDQIQTENSFLYEPSVLKWQQMLFPLVFM